MKALHIVLKEKEKQKETINGSCAFLYLLKHLALLQIIPTNHD